jgi:pyruvate/2-oxoglutarate dehydrogenase complex dihydrolipoamide dehydrogenase (E3) component
MPSIDPRLSQIPRELLQGSFDVRIYFEELERFLHDVWQNLDAGDAIPSADIRETYAWSVKRQTERINTSFYPASASAASSRYVNVSTSSNYTTTGFEKIIVVTGAVTVTLNSSPIDGEQVSIKRATTAGNVIVSGTIDGASSYTMAENYECVDLIYIASSNEWLIV